MVGDDFTGNTKCSTVSIAPPKSKTPSSSLCLPITARGPFTTIGLTPSSSGVDPKKNTISTDKYVWEQIAKAKTIGKCYVKAPEPQWNALWILFGEWPSDDDDEDESVYFDRVGTCLDDE
ncbi:hypothetical protein Salat_2698000 [Sesamum alatum]|uniref:Uncharacterized protein n=1 Tax=Sesamum alatum TaxID=300844 RepID=A0AAE1XQY2_9LAMI|nr:hypothetical protein Salat_2698000 [Sesamum alatum]